MNWDDLRIFLAAAKSKSFSEAAKSLQINQSTVSRRLSTMEDSFGSKLFERSSEGPVLTAAGTELQSMADGLEEEFSRIENTLVGREQSLSGFFE